MSAGYVFSFVLRSLGMETTRGVLGKAPGAGEAGDQGFAGAFQSG